jgi:hypothetical protein
VRQTHTTTRATVSNDFVLVVLAPALVRARDIHRAQTRAGVTRVVFGRTRAATSAGALITRELASWMRWLF